MWDDLFDFDGERLLRKRSIGGFHVGTQAGAIRISRPGAGPHLVVTVKRKRIYAHRIIWEMHHGKISDGFCIDHIDGNGLNNRLANLRLVEVRHNQKNLRKSRLCSTGLLGVGWHKASSKWRATINDAGKSVHLGLFESFMDAACARKSAEIRFGYYENHGTR